MPSIILTNVDESVDSGLVTQPATPASVITFTAAAITDVDFLAYYSEIGALAAGATAVDVDLQSRGSANVAWAPAIRHRYAAAGQQTTPVDPTQTVLFGLLRVLITITGAGGTVASCFVGLGSDKNGLFTFAAWA